MTDSTICEAGESSPQNGIRSFMLYEIEMNKFFQSPLKRHIVCCIYAISNGAKSILFKTKLGLRKGLVLKYEDFLAQGYSEREVRKTIKELIADGFIEKVGINNNRQLLMMAKKGFKLIVDFAKRFSFSQNSPVAVNEDKSNQNEPLISNSTSFESTENKGFEAGQNSNSCKYAEPTLANTQNSLKVKEGKAKEKTNNLKNSNDKEFEVTPDKNVSFQNNNDIDSLLGEYDPSLDLSLLEDELVDVVSDEPKSVESLELNESESFTGSFEDLSEIDAIQDGSLSEAQWNALPYFAKQINAECLDLVEAAMSVLANDSPKYLTQLIARAIELVQEQAIVAQSEFVAERLSGVKPSFKSLKHAANDQPKRCDYYAINKAEPLRDSVLTDCQVDAIYSAMEYVQRKAPAMRLDMGELFEWIYFQASNPQDHFNRSDFRKFMWIVIKSLLNGSYRRPKGFGKWKQELAA